MIIFYGTAFASFLSPVSFFWVSAQLLPSILGIFFALVRFLFPLYLSSLFGHDLSRLTTLRLIDTDDYDDFTITYTFAPSPSLPAYDPAYRSTKYTSPFIRTTMRFQYNYTI